MYKIFTAFSNTCWRKTNSKEFNYLPDAITEADRIAKEDNYLHVDYVVATHRDGNELYRAVQKETI
jgi:hypothetical protein